MKNNYKGWRNTRFRQLNRLIKLQEELKRNKYPDTEDRRRIARVSKYGITWDRFCELYTVQDGRCGICDKPISMEKEYPDISMAYIDHCHKVNKIRGLLCVSCNTGLGLLGDTASSIMNAYLYLENFEHNETT